jgi:hypothetical protein
MTTIPFVTSDWRRETAQEPILKVQNRFFEKNPSNFEEGSSLLIRPGFRRFTTLSDDMVLSIYSQESAFNNDTFTLGPLYAERVSSSGVSTTIVSGVSGYGVHDPNSTRGTFTGAIGDIPAYFYFCDNGSLWLYAESAFATATLTASGSIATNDVIVINGVYYKFVNGSVDAGSPDGSSLNPWLVDNNPANPPAAGLRNLGYAIDTLGIPGVDYSSATLKNGSTNTESVTGSTLVLRAAQAGIGGNTITVSEAGATLSWSSGTLSGGGGSAQVVRVNLPEEMGGCYAVETINGYVVCLAFSNSSSSTSGRFYWINPGDSHIDPLNFATAEIAPDSLTSVRAIGDQLFLMGKESTEVWYTTGDSEAPFRRINGRSLSTGTKPGTDIAVVNSLIVVSSDGIVYSLTGGEPQRISTNSIEELIRRFYLTDQLDDMDLPYAWQVTVDGHIFYVLGLGRDHTRAYDVSTGQWYDWKNRDSLYLRQHAGCVYYGSPQYQCVVGDTNSGTLWFVDPEYSYDDNPEDDIVEATLIPCVASAGIPMRTRKTQSCNQVYLTGSLGNSIANMAVYLLDEDGNYLVDEDGYYLLDLSSPPPPEEDSKIRLEYSDDNGKTWIVADQDVLIIVDDYTQEIVWRSLGRIMAPGRLFRISDYGIMRRLDGLDIL